MDKRVKKTSNLVAEALLGNEVVALCNHRLTRKDGKDYDLDRRSHLCIHSKLNGHLTLSH